MQWALEGGRVLRRVLRRSSKKEKALRRQKHALSRVGAPSRVRPIVTLVRLSQGPSASAGTKQQLNEACAALLGFPALMESMGRRPRLCVGRMMHQVRGPPTAHHLHRRHPICKSIYSSGAMSTKHRNRKSPRFSPQTSLSPAKPQRGTLLFL